jgi:integrase
MSVAKLLRALGFGSLEALPTQAGIVVNSLKGLRMRQGDTRGKAMPLQLGANVCPEGLPSSNLTVENMLAACDNTVRGLRDAAIVSLIYSAGLRDCELVAIEVSHLTFKTDGTGTLYLPNTRNGQFRDGFRIEISTQTVTRISAWLQCSLIKEGALFRSISAAKRILPNRGERLFDQEFTSTSNDWLARMSSTLAARKKVNFRIGDRPLVRRGLKCILQHIVKLAIEQGSTGLSLAEQKQAIATISTYSLRARLAKDMFAAGADEGSVARALRWKSRATALNYKP